ncbi:leucine-rich repeat domain-containing protein [Leptospira borgpetersenii]|uniref:leucine-rich repeat domain-containing protein n=1 Tax=Leptospira borgpetersenii TaxID=174 RepID=UPI000773857B|nr:leucine-rich repeat domain-containing protein [Leptospira borgpetersenii]MBE8401159.1 leucine-rich repeat domain-containing protein [Leptospira borgpetersenii serovar Tarassovi]MBE8404273.1 leucine-rich repeat domain-containing protein [Leptospira borgpetersenii serovar Tarassovi]MBE8405227.1 leucine-rich repeat domain-containing protein [Leptospira borgpetersenii serovar Tarassovi]MBE8412814.1 leucine-rich repeat domain-containing protein [Leptospira borgpetersenii serovar Tarassovi]MBE841
MKATNLQKIGTLILILLCFLSQLKAQEIGTYHNLTEALQNPTDVRILSLHNKLTTLPQEIGKLKKLRELDLTNNQLKTLPNEIGKLKELRKLYLDDIPAWRSQEERIRKLLPEVYLNFIEIEK